MYRYPTNLIVDFDDAGPLRNELDTQLTSQLPMSAPKTSTVLFMNGDDYADDTTTTGNIIIDGDIISGTFLDDNSPDWIRFEAHEGQEVQFLFTGVDFHARSIDIYDVNGNILSKPTSEAYFAYANWTAETTGVFYISLTNISVPNDYTVQAITIIDDFDNSTDTVGEIVVDGSATTGTNEVYGDEDWFRFEINAGEVIRFSTDTRDIRLYLYDSDGSSLPSFPYNSGPGTELVASNLESGTYYIATDSYLTRPNYSISAEFIEDDYPADASTSGVVEIGQATQGLTEYGRDGDAFKLVIEEPTSLFLAFDGLNFLPVTAFGASIYSEVDQSYSDFNTNANSQHFEPGIYYIIIYGSLLNGQPNSYSFRLSEDKVDEYTVEEIVADSADDLQDIIFDDERGLLYITSDNYNYSTSSFEVLRYDVNAAEFLDPFQISYPAGELSLSDDSNSLYIAPQAWTTGPPNVDVQVIDLVTGSNEQISYTVTNLGERTFRDIAVDANGSVLISDDFTGDGHLQLRVLNEGETVLTDVVGAVDLSRLPSLDVSSDGQFVLIVDDKIMLYSAESESIVAVSDFEVSNSSNNAISIEANLIAIPQLRSSQGSSLHIYDFELNSVAEIVLSNSAYIRHVSEFSSDGSYLFLWAQGIPYISVFDTQNFDAVGEIYLTQQFPLYLRGQNIEVSEDGTKLFLTTQYGFQVIDLEIAAPYTVPEPPISTDGDDIIYGTANDDTINALGGNDIVYGAAGDDTINGGDGNDLLRGDAGDDTLDGGFGVDWLRGGTGADVLNGWAGTDWADYITSSAGVTVNLLTNTATGGDAEGDTFLFIERVYGSSHDDHITGDNGVNYLRGWSGDDQLFGGIGNDYLQGGLGADALDGGDGSDWAYYISSSAGLTIDLQSPSFNTGEAVGDTYVSIENVVGSNHDDIIFGDSGNNFLRGANGDDSLAGGAGDDFLRGDLGADSLFGDAGNDWAYYAASNAGITINLTNAGAATGGHAAGDTFSSIERAFGSAFADSITGTFGANYLRGYFGNDSLVGGGGNDFLQGDAGADVLDGGAGLDWAYYASSTATGGITIHLGDSSQNTGEASGDSYISIENIVGSRYDDVITGDSGDNYLRGFLGDDILNGGAGNDTLRGEAGADIFVFEVGTGEDVVIDFVDSDDLLDFLDFGVADAMNNAAQVGDDVVFTFGADVITIQDITLADVADNVV